jgi:heme/copper-type cytochrome/quinol oxidase subunit 2
MKITEPSGRRPPGHRRARRLGGSLAAGAVAAGILVAWEDLHNHAALVASAAAPAPNGVHETVGFILATGGIFTFLVVAAVVFAVATVRARRRSARAGAGWQAEPARRGHVSARR